MNGIEFPYLGAKWTIGAFGLLHTSVASLAIGVAFAVTVAQIIAYRSRIYRYDQFAKRCQFFHVCIYNVGVVLAIGLIFSLSGLYPQFWSQLFTHFFWPFIVEEFLFFLLATTLTFHYFFWDRMWGHKKLHITLGALLTPMFLLQFYIINGIGSFMLTPGFGESEASLFRGILGWDARAFYNPSFLMLTFHRALANVSYAGFFLAGWCGVQLYLTNDRARKEHYEDCGRLCFYIGFTAFLSLPVIGYFYAHVLMKHASEAFWNLMLGQGDIMVGGVDTWWLKQLLVALMLGSSLGYFRYTLRDPAPFTLPGIMVVSVAVFYLMFYVAMGMVMTWRFFWWMLAAVAGGAALSWHMLSYGRGTARAVYLFLGLLAFMTVVLGGYAREASRPRFVQRFSHYDSVYKPTERQPVLMLPITPEELETVLAPPPPMGPAALIQSECARCHTLDRVRHYPKQDWERVVAQMIVYGARLTTEQAQSVTAHLSAGEPY